MIPLTPKRSIRVHPFDCAQGTGCIHLRFQRHSRRFRSALLTRSTERRSCRAAPDRIVILGGGFAGLYTALNLRKPRRSGSRG